MLSSKYKKLLKFNLQLRNCFVGGGELENVEIVLQLEVQRDVFSAEEIIYGAAALIRADNAGNAAITQRLPDGGRKTLAAQCEFIGQRASVLADSLLAFQRAGCGYHRQP